MQYKLVYRCKNGKHLVYRFESNRRLRWGNNINLMTNPLLQEVQEHIWEKRQDPNSKVNLYGGYDRLVSITNVSTGTSVQFNCF